MVSMNRRRRACLAAGLCAAGSNLPSCSAFSACPSSTSSFRPTAAFHASSTTANRAVRSRSTRVGSTVDVDSWSGVAEAAWSPPRRLDPEVVLLESAAATKIGGADGTLGGTVGRVAATVTEEPRQRKKRKGKDPELLEGDELVNTPKILGLVYSSLGFNALYLVQALSTVASPWQAVWTAASAIVGFVISDLVSGVFHWSVDNYGNGKTPVFGAVIDAFQGHHVSPWTITHRPFENNIHKICYAVLPLLVLLRLLNPGPEGVALGTFFLFGSLMSQEFHRYAHMTEPPAIVKALQDWGIVLSRKGHGQHHSSPFKGSYCIVSGHCNDLLDSSGVFRYLERIVYAINGVEPIAWKLEPALKEKVLAMTAWLPLANADRKTDSSGTTVSSS